MNSKRFTLLELSTITKSTLIGDPNYEIIYVNTLENASSLDVSFLANPRYIEAMKKSKAGVICIDSNTEMIEGKNYLISNDPSRTFQIIAEIILSNQKVDSSFYGIHETAVIHQSATIGKNVTIGPYSVIDKNAIISDNTRISSHVYVGPNVKIGKDCLFYSSCIVRENCVIGDRTIIQPGAVIGSCGFGLIPDSQGKFQKLQQIGNVILEDDVEIGANTTIDRARFGSTIIKKGTKIDNLVQIAHNVQIGENVAIAAQTGIAGSAKIGNNVLMGGQVGIVGHIEVTNNIMLATRSGVSKSIKNPGKYNGSPAIDLNTYNRNQIHLRQIEKYINIIKELEKKVASLEERLS